MYWILLGYNDSSATQNWVSDKTSEQWSKPSYFPNYPCCWIIRDLYFVAYEIIPKNDWIVLSSPPKKKTTTNQGPSISVQQELIPPRKIVLQKGCRSFIHTFVGIRLATPCHVREAKNILDTSALRTFDSGPLRVRSMVTTPLLGTITPSYLFTRPLMGAPYNSI